MNTSLIHFLVAAVLVTCPCFSSMAAPDTRVPAYFAKVTFTVSPEGRDVDQRLRKHLPKNDTSVKLEAVPNTTLYSIGVTASDPKAAAKRANEIALAIQAAIRSEADPKLLKIWEQAEPPIVPVTPTKAKE